MCEDRHFDHGGGGGGGGGITGYTTDSDAELWCFFDLHLNQQLSKQWKRGFLDAIALMMKLL